MIAHIKKKIAKIQQFLLNKMWIQYKPNKIMKKWNKKLIIISICTQVIKSQRTKE